MSQIDQVRRFFRPTLKALSANGTLTEVQAGAAFGREVVVLSRALCRFHYYPGDFRRSRAFQALQMRLRYESPAGEADSGLHIRAGESGAAVWTWDADKVQSLLGELRPQQVVPESALHPPGGSDLRCIACVDGVEGQLWENGEMTQSRWWPRTPDEREWKTFLRGARKTPETASAAEMAVRQAAWIDPPFVDEPAVPWLRKMTYRHAVLIAGLLLLGPVSFELARWSYAEIATARYRAELEERRAEAQPSLTARREAIAAMAQTDEHIALGDSRLLLRALLDARAALDPAGLRIERIQLNDANIQLYVSAPGQENTAGIVQALEDTPSWTNVSLQPSSAGKVVLRGRLEPFSGPLAAAAGEG